MIVALGLAWGVLAGGAVAADRPTCHDACPRASTQAAGHVCARSEPQAAGSSSNRSGCRVGAEHAGSDTPPPAGGGRVCSRRRRCRRSGCSRGRGRLHAGSLLSVRPPAGHRPARDAKLETRRARVQRRHRIRRRVTCRGHAGTGIASAHRCTPHHCAVGFAGGSGARAPGRRTARLICAGVPRRVLERCRCGSVSRSSVASCRPLRCSPSSRLSLPGCTADAAPPFPLRPSPRLPRTQVAVDPRRSFVLEYLLRACRVSL